MTVYCPCPSSAKPTRTVILPKRSMLDRRALGHAGAGLADDRVGVPVEDAGLDRVDETDAEVAALARAPSPAARAELSVVAHLEHGIERGLVVAAVVLVAARDRVGKRSFGMKFRRRISPGIERELARRDVHQLLEHEVVRRRAHAAIRDSRQLVGRDDRQIVLRRRNRVAAGERGERLRRADGAPALGRGAEIVEQLHAKAGDLAVGRRARATPRSGGPRPGRRRRPGTPCGLRST